MTPKLFPKAIILVLVCAAVTIDGLNVAVAYDDDITHPTLTEIAVARSRIANDPNLLLSIGLDEYGLNRLGNSDAGIPIQNIVELMRFGAYQEDTGVKSLKHFFDPQNNRGLTLGPIGFESSPDWILADTTSAAGTAEYSYKNAREMYFEALTASSVSEREEHFAKMFVSLGHVLHHIQDMGQPQHTRNDIHCNVDVCDNFRDSLGRTLYRPSLYEDYSKQPRQTERLLNGQIPTANYPIQAPVLLEPRHYWQNSNNPGGGMAEFVSNHFITENDILLFSPGLGVLDVATPGFTNPNGSSFSLVPANCTLSGSQGTTQSPCDIVQGTAFDPLTGITNVFMFARKSALYEYINEQAIATGTQNLFFENMYGVGPSVFDSYYVSLMPRITSFGAGLLDYFFRGSAELTVEQNFSSVRISNTGSEQMTGRFYIYSDSADGERSMVTSDGWAGGRYMFLQPGETSSSIPFTRPTTNDGNLMLVFRGEIGEEGRGATDTISAVSAKQYSFSDIEITFGDNGPNLDDVYSLTLKTLDGHVVDGFDDVYADSSPHQPVVTHTVTGKVPPGDYEVSLYVRRAPCVTTCQPYGNDANGAVTYIVDFSSNVTVQPGGLPLSNTLYRANGVNPIKWAISIN